MAAHLAAAMARLGLNAAPAAQAPAADSPRKTTAGEAGLATAQTETADERAQAVRDLHAMEEQQAANGMFADARLEDLIRAQRARVEHLSRNESGSEAAGVAESAALPPESANRPVESADGPFGPILHGYEGRWRDAALELERRQSGEAPGALSHPEVGPIALVWGNEGTGKSDGFGLAKLIAWHPEVLDDLQGRLNGMKVKSRSTNRIRLESEDGEASVRLDYDGRTGAWLMTAYDIGLPRRTERSMNRLSDLWGDLAPSPRRGTSNVEATADSGKADDPQPASQAVEKTGTTAGEAQNPESSATGANDGALEPASPEPATEAPPAPGGLKGLTDEENAELARLEVIFAKKMKDQLNAGLDPEMIATALQIGRLYVRAGSRRFRAMLEAMMNRMGLTLAQAEPYARNAYNQIRDDMELTGEGVGDMDSSAEVLAEVRKMRAAAEKQSRTAPERATVKEEAATAAGQQEENANDDHRRDQGTDQAGDAGRLGGTLGRESGSQRGSQDRVGRGDDGHRDEALSGDGPGERLADDPRRNGFLNEDAGDDDAARDDTGAPDEGENAPDAQAGDRAPTAPQAADPGRAADAPPDTRRGTPPPNFVIADDFALGEGTAGEKLAANLAALRMVRALDAENRYATPEEQAILARWVGWGGLKTVFDKKHEGATSAAGHRPNCAHSSARTNTTRPCARPSMRITPRARW